MYTQRPGPGTPHICRDRRKGPRWLNVMNSGRDSWMSFDLCHGDRLFLILINPSIRCVAPAPSRHAHNRSTVGANPRHVPVGRVLRQVRGLQAPRARQHAQQAQHEGHGQERPRRLGHRRGGLLGCGRRACVGKSQGRMGGCRGPGRRGRAHHHHTPRRHKHLRAQTRVVAYRRWP